MKAKMFLAWVLGAWLGGSLIIGGVVSYNFAGLEDLFARNPKLADHAGFTLEDEAAKKTSLIWVHSSELNRVFFETWNRAQLVLGGLALVLALGARAGKLATLLLLLAVVLVACTHFLVEPQIVSLGRQLDFASRVPPPPEMGAFQRQHGIYFTLEAVRLVLMAGATLILLFRSSGKNAPAW